MRWGLRCDTFIRGGRRDFVGGNHFAQVNWLEIQAATKRECGVERTRGLFRHERLIAATIGQNAAGQVDVAEGLRAGHARTLCDCGHQFWLGRGDLVLSVQLGATLRCGQALDLA